MLWNSVDLFSKACLKITQLLPTFSKVNTYCNTSCIKIDPLFAFSAIKNWGVSKSDQITIYLKEWMLVNGKSFLV